MSLKNISLLIFLSFLCVQCNSQSFLGRTTLSNPGGSGQGQGSSSEDGKSPEEPVETTNIFNKGDETIDPYGPDTQGLPPVSLPAPNMQNLMLVAAPNMDYQPLAVGLQNSVVAAEGTEIDTTQFFVAVAHREMPSMQASPLARLSLKQPLKPLWLSKLVPSALATGFELVEKTLCNETDVSCCPLSPDGSFQCLHFNGLTIDEMKDLHVVVSDGYRTAPLVTKKPDPDLHYLRATPKLVAGDAQKLVILSEQEQGALAQTVAADDAGQWRVTGKWLESYSEPLLPEFPEGKLPEEASDLLWKASRVMVRDPKSGIYTRKQGEEKGQTIHAPLGTTIEKLREMRSGKVAYAMRTNSKLLSDNYLKVVSPETLKSVNVLLIDQLTFQGKWQTSLNASALYTFDQIATEETEYSIVYTFFSYEDFAGKKHLALNTILSSDFSTLDQSYLLADGEFQHVGITHQDDKTIYLMLGTNESVVLASFDKSSDTLTLGPPHITQDTRYSETDYLAERSGNKIKILKANWASLSIEETENLSVENLVPSMEDWDISFVQKDLVVIDRSSQLIRRITLD